MRHFLVSLAVAPIFGAKDGPIADTEHGKVQGLHGAGKKSENEYDTDTYFGIPYAAPPIGQLRFKPPQPFTDSWSPSIRQATELGQACAQTPVVGARFAGGEDCLYLNVYTPSESTVSSALPVQIWIYGGGYIFGEGFNLSPSLDGITEKVGSPGLYDGRRVVKKHGYVIVSMNYRLNGFGFIALPELQAENADATTGNYGAQDQRAAFQWVQRNIKNFGGDPNAVTISGESAGGISVGFHLVSPQSKGLFHAAILESGNGHNSWFVQPKNDSMTFWSEFSEIRGCKPGPGRLGCLRTLPVEAFMVSAKEMVNDWFYRCFHFALPDDIPGLASSLYPLFPVGLVIDGSDAGLPDEPMKMFERGEFAPVPVITGANRDGGGYFGPILPLLWGAIPFTGFRFEKLLAWMLPQEKDRQRAMELYGGDDFPSNRKRFNRWVRDAFFPCNNRDMAASWSKAGVKAYHYMFSFEFHEWLPPIDELGAAHGFEMIFTWRNWRQFYSTLAMKTKEYDAMADVMSCTWASFVKCQEPKCATPPTNCVDALARVPTWPHVDITKDHHYYMSLKQESSVEYIKPQTWYGFDEHPGDEKCDFWHDADLSWQNIRYGVAKTFSDHYSPSPAPPGPIVPNTHYGQPPLCKVNEEVLKMTADTVVCASACEDEDDCPPDTPAGGNFSTQEPKCGRRLPGSKRAGKCYIPCMTAGDCAQGQSCVSVTLEKGVCVFPLPDSQFV